MTASETWRAADAASRRPLVASVRHLAPALTLLATLATAGSTWAAMAPAAPAELAREATVVALGRIERAEGRWNADRSAVRTEVTAAALRVVKGAVPRGGRLVFSVAGGEVGDTGVAVSGAARPRVGEEAVLLLAPGPDGLAPVAGEQGYLPVRAGKVTVDGRALGLDRFLADLRRYAG
jgi:hypothetical protein